MKSNYIECTSNQCSSINSIIADIELPPGFELFSLTMLSQILSRPDQDLFSPYSFFNTYFYNKIFGSKTSFFDMNGPFWDILEKYNKTKEEYKLYKYSDFAEDAIFNIFNPDLEAIDKIFHEQIFNRQELKFYPIDENDEIINVIEPPLAQSIIIYSKSSYIHSNIPEAICNKEAKNKSKSFFPALEHVWTLYRENNKYSLHIRFFKSIYIPYRPSDKALPVAVCYYPNTLIKLIAQNFKKNSSKPIKPQQNLISLPSQFNSNSIKNLLSILSSYMESDEYHNLIRETRSANILKLFKLSALNSGIFAHYFLKIDHKTALYFSVISIYPKAEWKNVSPFLSSDIRQNQFKNIKNQYLKFILWLIHATAILKEKGNVNYDHVLGLLTTTNPANDVMISLSYFLYSHYYKYVLYNKRADPNLLIKVSRNGNYFFPKKGFYYINNGKKVVESNPDVICNYGFDCLDKSSTFTIPEQAIQLKKVIIIFTKK